MTGARYNYAPAPPDILERVRRIEAVCIAHGVKLIEAALQFVLGHPVVKTVIPGANSPDQVKRQRRSPATPSIPPALWSDLKTEGLLRAAMRRCPTNARSRSSIMLIGIDPLLSPDLLRILRAMGHGDEIAIVDANYPATSATPSGLSAWTASMPARRSIAILSVLPLDSFVEGAGELHAGGRQARRRFPRRSRTFRRSSTASPPFRKRSRGSSASASTSARRPASPSSRRPTVGSTPTSSSPRA